MKPDGLVIRAVREDELEAYRACMWEAFGHDPSGDPDGQSRLQGLLDRSRTYCAFDGARIVGTCATWTMQLAVCGGVVPMAGLTMVSVRSTHRRRGLLRRMIAGHLDDAAARGEPVSGLWASDAPIYGRFGYGVAAEGDELAAGRDDGFGRGRALDQVELVSEEAAARTLPAVYAAAMAHRPGIFARSDAWWRLRRFADRAAERKGRSPRRYLVATRAGAPTGYAVYRQQLHFDEGRPAGALDVEELIALDANAEATLWDHVTHVDLFPRVSWWNAPTDCLAPYLTDDRRRVTRKRRADTLWLRIGDVGAALAARGYRDDGELVLGVRDAQRGELRRWRLRVEGGRGACAPTDDEVDLELGQAALGAIYLGGTPPSLLAGTGAIAGSAAALARADRLFGWPIAPWCPEVF
jgi:predicted acetyltransferase